MTEPALVVRFATDIDPGKRADFLTALSGAGLPATAGWNLGYRGPDEEDSPRVAALLDLMADVTEIGASAITDLGLAATRFLRAVSAPEEETYVELSDRPSQRVWRLSATDTPVAHRSLARGATPRGDAPATWNGTAWSADKASPADPSPPTAFVSYAQESDRHKAAVMAFCEMLTVSGVETRLDRWHLDERDDWQLWATRQVTRSDYVIVVASETCRRVGDGENEEGTNLGLASEMRLLREVYHADNEQWRKRILPVILPGQRIEGIPLFLQPRTADHFELAEITAAAAEDLLRVVHRKPPFQPPPVGPVPDLA
jgi:SEFIR domain